MPIVESELALLKIPRLAALATSAWPAWLWTADGSRMLWANAVGAAIFGAANAAEVGAVRSGALDAAATQISRIAATLGPAGQDRLERLRGFGAGFGRALLCSCARLALPDGSAAVLVAATEAAGPALPLRERVRRILPDNEFAYAAFSPDGALIHANTVAPPRLGGAATLSALGADALAATALATGYASGATRLGGAVGEVSVCRLGKDESRVLVLTLPPPGEAVAEMGAPQDSERVLHASVFEAAAPVPLSQVPAAPPPSHQIDTAVESTAERRHPLRFVWQMDAADRFMVGSDEFIELVGPRTIAACGRAWSEIATELKLDPDHQVARAVATRETWSGIEISWPVEDTSERLPVELSGLPVFDRERTFQGYRGFGVCRDLVRINELARARRSQPIGFMPAPSAPHTAASDSAPSAAPEPAAEIAALNENLGTEELPPGGPAGNVVPFRAGAFPEVKVPALSAGERIAFSELAEELSARLRGSPGEPIAAADTPRAASGLSAAAELAPVAAQVAATLPVTEEAQPSALAIAEHVLLDRVPAGVLIHRDRTLLYANRHFFELSGYDDLPELVSAGGLHALFAEPGTNAVTATGSTGKFSIVTRAGDTLPVECRLFSVPWSGSSALALVLTSGQAEERQRAAQLALEAAQSEIGDLKSSLDRTTRRETQKAAAAKAEFLAKVSHEIRTPLNSMIGFAEVIMAERFGPIGNERYREYLKDMHAAGTHLVSLLNDLLDLSKVETGQLDLNFGNVDLNDLVQQCVGVMQPQANRARIIIRTALASGLTQVVADARSLRQIVINLLANAIKLTGPGGQVIVSTAFADTGETVLRVRDTGVGMREVDIEAVLEPFHQTATSASWDSGGTGLGLPLTKALAEANRASFSIKSAPNAGTLIEITFPPRRANAQ
jgi:signal transduction histidine kinase